MLILTVHCATNPVCRRFSVSLLRLLPDAIQYSDTGTQIGRRNVVEKLVSKSESRGTDLFNDPTRARRQMDGLAAAIMRRASARDPTITFESMQQSRQSGLFDSKVRGDLGLSQGAGRDRQMHQGPPLRLAQAHRLESFVQFQSPGPGSAVQERTEMIDVASLHGSKIVSLLTNSKTEAVSMPPRYSILSSKIDSFR
jgi:hypothetical protein